MYICIIKFAKQNKVTKNNLKMIGETQTYATRISWRDTLRNLSKGKSFEAHLLNRPSISAQIAWMKKNEGLNFVTSKISETKFKVTRIK